jgi:Glycosyltransferase family 87
MEPMERRENSLPKPIFNRLAAVVLLMALTTFVSLRGLVPALHGIDTDFPNYFTAARIVADGRDVRRLYDNSWFQEQMRRYGMESEGSFSPFPPPTALLLVPLARLQPLSALRVVSVISVLCLIGSMFLLARVLAWSVLDSAVFLLLSGNAIVSCLRFGQPYILISALCVLGYYAYLRRRFLLAGICWGLFVPIKYYPLIILAYLTWRKQWQVVLGGALAILGVALISISVLGWKIHATFLLSILGNHLTANIGAQDPFTAYFQSFDTLFRRLFMFDPVRNPQPLWSAPALQVLALVITKTAILLAAVAALVRLARTDAAAAVAPSVGILGILGLLIAPATATYHFILLWLPIGLLSNYLLRQGARVAAYFTLGAYALIGFFPYKYTYPFEGRGVLTVLAYPRLFLLLAMFIVCVHCIGQLRDPAPVSARDHCLANSKNM